MIDPAKDPRLIAVVKFIGKTGAKNFQIRYSDDPEPLVWVADAEWPHGRLTGSGLTPGEAAMALAQRASDPFRGGRCAHCGRPAGVTDEWEDDQPLAELICWFVYDPETVAFRRSCEGETSGRAYGMDPETGRTVGRNDLCPCGSGLKWKRCHGA